MWLRLIGGGLLLSCGCLWAGAQAREERARAARVAARGELFARIGEQIGALCLPLDEITARLPPDLLAAAGCDARTPAALCAADLGDAEAGECLSRAAAHLGRGSREDQVRLCRETAQTLQARGERLAAEAARNARARGTLTVTACLGAMILLW